MKPIQQWTVRDIIDFIRQADKKVWLKIGAAAVGSLLLVLFILWPAWVTRVGIHNEVKNTEARMASLEALKKNQPEWTRDRTEFAAHIAGVKDRLYGTSDASLLLGEISKLAKQSKVSIIASRPQTSDVKYPEPYVRQYEAKDYGFTVEGGYHDLGVFISMIESYPKILRIQSFQILSRAELPQSHLCDIRLSAISKKVSVPS